MAGGFERHQPVEFSTHVGHAAGDHHAPAAAKGRDACLHDANHAQGTVCRTAQVRTAMGLRVRAGTRGGSLARARFGRGSDIAAERLMNTYSITCAVALSYLGDKRRVRLAH